MISHDLRFYSHYYDFILIIPHINHSHYTKILYMYYFNFTFVQLSHNKSQFSSFYDFYDNFIVVWVYSGHNFVTLFL